MAAPKLLSPQTFRNGAMHDWYRIVLGYSDHLVSKVIDDLALSPGDIVLDPFCGSGTTVVECKKSKIDCVGVDANPSSVFASRVKTNWDIDPEELLSSAELLQGSYDPIIASPDDIFADATYRYITSSGMLRRGWISESSLQKSIAVKLAIACLDVTSDIRNALTLSLVSEVVQSASNIRFGPELYCGAERVDVDVLSGVERRIARMANNLNNLEDVDFPHTEILLGDARNINFTELSKTGCFDAIICSPPYPTEHDYTRNSRLELVFLESVLDSKSLQSIKKTMLRSHTKGIYKGDSDAVLVSGNARIWDIANRIHWKVHDDSSGFARLYSRVVREYFGGMKRHFINAIKGLRPGGHAVYVVGDQNSYHGVNIPTAEILEDLAIEVGFESCEISKWRSRWSSSSSSMLAENILKLQRPLNRDKS
jgi:hypothetical protein